MNKWPEYTSTALAQIDRFLASRDISSIYKHEAVESFENAFGKQISSTKYNIHMSSGTAGLLSALYALDLPEKAYVAVQNHTFRAGATALTPLGYRPVVVGTDVTNGQMDLDCLEEALRSVPIKAVVVTHLWGGCCDLTRLGRLASVYGLKIIEDSSHAHGVHYTGQPLGSFFDASIYSCGTTKIISGIQGGMFCTNDQKIFLKAMSFGQPKHYLAEKYAGTLEHQIIQSGMGYNFRSHPVAAVLAREHLDSLPERVSQRISTARMALASVNSVFPELRELPQSDKLVGYFYYKIPLIGAKPSTISLMRKISAETGISFKFSNYRIDKLRIFEQLNIDIKYFIDKDREDNFFKRLIVGNPSTVFESDI